MKLKPGSRELLAQAQALLATIGLTACDIADLAFAVDIDDELNNPDYWETRPADVEEWREANSDIAQDAWNADVDAAFTYFED